MRIGCIEKPFGREVKYNAFAGLFGVSVFIETLTRNEYMVCDIGIGSIDCSGLDWLL